MVVVLSSETALCGGRFHRPKERCGGRPKEKLGIGLTSKKSFVVVVLSSSGTLCDGCLSSQRPSCGGRFVVPKNVVWWSFCRAKER